MFKKVLTPAAFKELRVKSGYSQEELAQLMNWSVGTVYNYETKECKLSFYDFEKFILITSNNAEERAERKKMLSGIEKFLEKILASPV